MTHHNDTTTLRQQLNATFDDVELDAFCLDHFPDAYDKFSRGQRRDEKIHILLEHCTRQPGGLEELANQLTERQSRSRQRLSRAEYVAGPEETPRVNDRSVLFDVGHGQQKWGVKLDSERPVVSHDYRPFAGIICDLDRQPVEVKSLTEETLRPAPLLVLVLPNEDTYSHDEVRDIKGFVRNGGGLLALSYYGGDPHAQTNLNKVLEEFGITTAADRVMDNDTASWTNRLQVTAYAAPGNGLLPEGESLVMPFCCSLALDREKNPAAKPIVQSSENSLTQVLETEGGRALTFEPERPGSQVLGAVATYGMGRVAVLGSWQAFTTVSLTTAGFANRHLLEVLLKWLIKEDADAAGGA